MFAFFCSGLYPKAVLSEVLVKKPPMVLCENDKPTTTETVSMKKDRVEEKQYRNFRGTCGVMLL